MFFSLLCQSTLPIVVLPMKIKKIFPKLGYISKIEKHFPLLPKCPNGQKVHIHFEDLVEDPSVLLAVISKGQ